MTSLSDPPDRPSPLAHASAAGPSRLSTPPCSVRVALGLVLLLALGSLLLLPACRGTLKLEPDDAPRVLARQALDAPDPSEPGTHRVRRLYYGSGTDRRRPEYRDSVTLVTPTVDASKLVSFGAAAAERKEYWGFGPDSFPLNARVWAPEGPGPFPLVLIVHGNHDMKDYSDPGYAYLGRHLASRGFIAASVDMNFVNGGVRGENDARGWLLLKHLQQWRRWNTEPDSPFSGRVDMDRIALVGHSRGGEAVSDAAAFNRLSRYPDDASLTFDFGFGIQSVVALAPVDGQYLPADRKVPLRDVNFLVLHGSHDGDVTSFHGLRPYQRLRFTDGTRRFKAAVYVYRANHGQWNTVWGAHDSGPRSGRILDLRALMPGEDQRRVARVYVTAFLEATLDGRDEYLPLFLDHRVAGHWLPPTMYVTHLQTSGFHPLATFEEDIDVTTGSAPGVRLSGAELAVWKEGELMLRSSNWPTTSRSQENQVAWLGWEGRPDSGGEESSFAVEVPAELPSGWGVDGSWTLDLQLGPTEHVPGRKGPADTQWWLRDDQEPVDLTVEVRDAGGHRARVDLGRYGAVRRPLHARILRRADMEEERFPDLYDVILQTYSIPLADFVAREPAFDPTAIDRIRLIFDRTPAGEVVVDDIGLTRMDPAFLRARVAG